MIRSGIYNIVGCGQVTLDMDMDDEIAIVTVAAPSDGSGYQPFMIYITVDVIEGGTKVAITAWDANELERRVIDGINRIAVNVD